MIFVTSGKEEDYTSDGSGTASHTTKDDDRSYTSESGSYTGSSSSRSSYSESATSAVDAEFLWAPMYNVHSFLMDHLYM